MQPPMLSKSKKNPSERNPNTDYKNREVIIFGTLQGLERHEGSKNHEIQLINETVQRDFDESIWQNGKTMKPTELSVPEEEEDVERQDTAAISAQIEKIAELKTQAAADQATISAQTKKVAELDSQASEDRATISAHSEKIGEGERFEKKAEKDIKLAEQNGPIFAVARSTLAYLVGVHLLPMTGLELFTPAVVEESHHLRLQTLLADKTVDHGAAELESGTMDNCESLDSVEKVGGMDFSIYFYRGVIFILTVAVVWQFLAGMKRDNKAKEGSENLEEQ